MRLLFRNIRLMLLTKNHVTNRVVLPFEKQARLQGRLSKRQLTGKMKLIVIPSVLPEEFYLPGQDLFLCRLLYLFQLNFECCRKSL